MIGIASIIALYRQEKSLQRHVKDTEKNVLNLVLQSRLNMIYFCHINYLNLKFAILTLRKVQTYASSKTCQKTGAKN